MEQNRGTCRDDDLSRLASVAGPMSGVVASRKKQVLLSPFRLSSTLPLPTSPAISVFVSSSPLHLPYPILLGLYRAIRRSDVGAMVPRRCLFDVLCPLFRPRASPHTRSMLTIFSSKSLEEMNQVKEKISLKRPVEEVFEVVSVTDCLMDSWRPATATAAMADCDSSGVWEAVAHAHRAALRGSPCEGKARFALGLPGFEVYVA